MSEVRMLAGFDRLDITPPNGGIPLEGLGSSLRRRAAVIRDRLYVNTVAFGKGDAVEAVLLTFDWINVKNAHLEEFRAIVAGETGLEPGRILMGGTHTHSAPDIYSNCEEMQIYIRWVKERLASTVRRAVKDMKPAALSFGRMVVGHEGAWLNFCKHYKMAPMEKRDSWTEADLVDAGDNYGQKYSSDEKHWFYARHEEEADHEMQLIRLAREDADDIVLVNFQAHAMITAHGNNPVGMFRNELSSDFPGVTCQAVEKLLPRTRCVYYQGAAGNVNPSTRMGEEGIRGLTYAAREPEPYAAVLAYHVKRICEAGLTPSQTDTVRLVKTVLTAESDHSGDHRVPQAQEVWNAFQAAGKQTPEVKELLKKYGFNSPYHAEAIISKSKKPATLEMELNAVRLGDAALITAPCEMFNATGVYIKDHSPFAMTFVKAYSCGSVSYMPSANVCKDCYEWNCARTKPGTAEQVAEEQLRMLNELSKN